MANAPSHSPNAATKMVTIYNEAREEFNVSRLNALDLIRGGGYFWKAEDINKRPESEGPADPSAKVQTIYDAEGKPFEVDSANARDMIGTGKYFWNAPSSDAPVEETVEASEEPTGEEETTDATTDVAEDDTTPAPTAETDVVPSEEALADQALRVTGKDDVIAYLEGFAEQALRDMAMERYGEKLHHRASKETLITKIIEQEDARTVGDDQADA